MKKSIICFSLLCTFFLYGGNAEELSQTVSERDLVVREIVLKLHEIGAVKFGSYTLKSGTISPIYIDLRVIISDPKLLRQIGEVIWNKIEKTPCEFLCGVPYTALPIATGISLEHNIPMVMRRKEVKKHGTRRTIEGIYQPGQRCVVIEDLVTSAQSVLETICSLESEGLKVTDVAVFIDREQGGRQRLRERGYTLHSVLTLPTLLNILEQEQIISLETVTSVNAFLKANIIR